MKKLLLPLAFAASATFAASSFAVVNHATVNVSVPDGKLQSILFDANRPGDVQVKPTVNPQKFDVSSNIGGRGQTRFYVNFIKPGAKKNSQCVVYVSGHEGVSLWRANSREPENCSASVTKDPNNKYTINITTK